MSKDDVISADSHVFEPHDLWERRIAARFRDRAPRIVPHGDQEALAIDGVPSEAMMPMGSAGVESAKLKDVRRHSQGRAGGWDPDARIKDMDVDGIDAEVLYPSLAMRLFRIQDAAYQQACFRAYNDWLAEFCGVYPKRLVGVGLVSLLDVEAGLGELRRIAGKGLRSAAISADLTAGAEPFWSPRFDPFWREASALGMPVSLHLGTNAGALGAVGDFLARYVTLPMQFQVSIANLIAGGVLERFPELKIVSVENDVGWAPVYLARIDHAYERYPHWTGAKLKLLPSEYFRRQVWMTFIDDRAGVEARHRVGVDRMMWSTDYPHPDSTWPESQKCAERLFRDVPAEERRKIVGENARRLYRLA